MAAALEQWTLCCGQFTESAVAEQVRLGIAVPDTTPASVGCLLKWQLHFAQVNRVKRK